MGESRRDLIGKLVDTILDRRGEISGNFVHEQDPAIESDISVIFIVDLLALLVKEVAAINDTLREAWIFDDAESRAAFAPALPKKAPP